MRVYTSGLHTGLQGASDTLGGFAEFERGNRRDKALLEQRQLEEQRRQLAFQADLEQAQRRAALEERELQAHQATQGMQYALAQQGLEERRNQIYQQLRGGPPTVDQDQELQRVGTLARHLRPENAEVLLKELGQRKRADATVRGLQGFTEQLAQPVVEGSLQDPQAQQQLGLLQQSSQALMQMVESGEVDPEDVPSLMDRFMDDHRAILQESAKRQADLQVRQATMQGIAMHKQGLMPGDPRLRKLSEMEQLVSLGLIDEKQVGRELMAEQFGISDEEMADFEVFQAERNKQRAREAILAPAVALRQLASEAGVLNGRQQAPKAVPRGALVRLRDAVRSATSPEEIDAVAAQLGISELSPEEEAFVRGG